MGEHKRNPNVINPENPMTRMVLNEPMKFIALLLWKFRWLTADGGVEITSADLNGLITAFAPGQNPTVAVIGKETSMVMKLLDKSGAELLLAKDVDNPAVAEMERMLQARKDAPGLTARLRRVKDHPLQMWDHSEDELVEEICDALMLLSGPHPQEDIAPKVPE